MTKDIMVAFAKLVAIQAEIAGMTAENMARQENGLSMAYTDTEFFRCATEAEEIAERMLECGDEETQ